MSVRKVITEHVKPPAPSKQYDWRATFDGYEPGDYIGTGPDEASAIADLLIGTDYEGGIELRRANEAQELLQRAAERAQIRRLEREEWFRKNAPPANAHEKAAPRRFTGEAPTGFGALDNQQEEA